MRRAAALLLAVLAVTVLVLVTVSRHGLRADVTACSVAKSALEAARQIKPGMTRGDVESHFYVDGGAQIPDATRYVYRGCQYIRVDVSFKLPPSATEFSPNDIVIEASRPYLAYPTMD